ncbi:hexokinase-3 [Pelodiscus sinensis]|uniref:hexokinase-3 n=1 Tax=Pelodiscus sinensis TaxID=13735 RepID=UPI003F6AC8BA
MQRALQPLCLSLAMLRPVMERMLEAMERGLSHRTHDQATVRMLPAFIRSTPDGTERGDFLVLDLGETRLRVLLVELRGEERQTVAVQDQTFPVSEELRRGSGQQLFAFMAKCLWQFLDGRHPPQRDFELGLSFPFTCRQTRLDKSVLISWSKGFTCPGVEGQDVVRLLQNAIDEQDRYRIKVIAVVSDTVGTMMSSGAGREPCEVGLVVDAGTNSCFMAEARHVETVDEVEGRMAVVTEWGFFGDDGALHDVLSDYDRQVDQTSLNPGRSRFEKMISSLYLGEIVRLAVVDLASQGGLFRGRTTPCLLTPGSIPTQHVQEITDEQVGLSVAQQVLQELGLEASDQDCVIVQQVCSAVCSRAAGLCAAGLAAILSHMRRSRELPRLKTSVAVDGDVFWGSAKFLRMLEQWLRQLAPECEVSWVRSRDGRGRGIAMVAAVASRLPVQHQRVNEILAPLRLLPEALGTVQGLLRREMELGLKETQARPSVRMLPTYVRATPDGSERGDFLALDLGGTNFRVLLVQVGGGEQGGVRIVSEVYSIPTQVAQGPGSQLFDHIVECIADFQAKQGLVGRTLPLGFTFSFPCQQTGLDQGILLSWTKGFKASGCEGQDVVKLLREAVARKHHFELDVVAIVNDTVGTMMSCGYDDPSCEVGLIVGTDTNACYMEELRNVGALAGEEEGRMCINMEWGAFGDNGCLDAFFTPFDAQVDAASLNPGKQRFEKLISGMYLGEIVRRVLLKLTAEGLLFRGRPSPKLQTPDIFQTKFLSSIESDGLALRQVCAILEALGLHVTCEDSLLVREVCQVVARRAAQLCGAGVAAVVEKIRENRGLEQLAVTVGVDGTLYKLHPHFAQQVQATVKCLAPRCHVTFLQSEDGSGKGAALIAAVACRVGRRQR